MRTATLRRLRAEGAALLRWWIRELRDTGLQLLERTAPRLTKHVVIEFKGNTAEAYVLRRDSPSDRITISRDPSGAWSDRLPAGATLGDPHGARATLVLAPEDTLSFELLIPHALGRDLDKVIALRLERELPLARDQFGVDYHVREHLSGTGKIRVQVLVAHRSHLDQLRELAQRWNLRPTRIAALSDAGAFVGDFLRNPFRFRMMRLTLLERRLSALVLVLACMLGALTAGQWVYERIVVGAQLRRVDAQAQVASHLTEQLNRESAPARDLLRIMRVPDASDVLAALTRTVPPYAWVYRLSVDAPTSGAASIRMGAFAPPATALVRVLEQTHRFGKVQLLSATSVGGASGLDRFKLTASHAAARPGISGPHRTSGVSAVE